MRTRSVVAIAALVTACAPSPRYAYRPTRQTALEDAPGDLDGQAAAAYPVPQNVPRGDVQIATLGVTTMKLPAGRDARALRAVHVRMIVHNGGSEVWLVDAIDQSATITTSSGSVQRTPVLARCDGEVLSQAVLQPDDTRTIDLLYELPSPLVDAAVIPSVRVDWRVTTPTGVLARESSAFERHTILPPPVPAPDPKQMAKGLAQSHPDWPSWRN